MAYNFGQPKTPEQSSGETPGESKDADKKDKKSVRFPLSGVKGEAKPESNDRSEKVEKTARKLPLHELFAKQSAEQKDQAAKSTEQKDIVNDRQTDTAKESNDTARTDGSTQEAAPERDAEKSIYEKTGEAQKSNKLEKTEEPDNNDAVESHGADGASDVEAPGEHGEEPLILPEVANIELTNPTDQEMVMMARESDSPENEHSAMAAEHMTDSDTPGPRSASNEMVQGAVDMADAGDEAVTESKPPVVPPPFAYSSPLFRRTESTADPLSTSSGNEGGGGMPPIIPPAESTPSGTPDEPERPSGTTGWGMPPLAELYATRPSETTYAGTAESGFSSGESVVSERDRKRAEREAADKEYYAEKRGLSRGVGSGAVLGWMLGKRSGRNRAERAAAKEIDRRTAKIEELETDKELVDQRIGVLKRTRERLESQVKSFEHTIRPSRNEAVLPTVATPENNLRRTERVAAVTSVAAERARAEGAARPEVAPLSPELLPENQPITEESMLAPEGRRVEISAWHRYEVDAATGKVVDDPEVAYGEEFRKEQKQELLADKPFEPIAAVQIGQAAIQNAPGAHAGGMVPVSGYVPVPGQLSQPVAADNVTPKSGMVPVQDTAELDAAIAKPADGKMKRQVALVARQVATNARNPLIWITAVMLVVVLFIVGPLG